MAIYIKIEDAEKVIIDPRGDDDFMIELFSQMPGVLEIRKLSEQELKKICNLKMKNCKCRN
ncbi:hypothetical protein [Pseudoalteromonas sp. GutCa3]|uniref:hypothetical protein n=1 Tax=Pseudoalteromonas sp. GutCa3 TaxID=888433 RepID=UPI000C341029|nr:hypothetical protein [Pseudoalteromonas sp. GutCa3]PKG68673.1 hypothetical protein CXF64_20340 [Pseudoalteromonas sp. GutCa3]